MKRYKKPLLIILLASAMLMGCQKEVPSQSSSSSSQSQETASLSSQAPDATGTITDRSGQDVVLPAEMNRIISGAPSNTEILTALGLGDKLIAVDEYSNDIEGIPSDAVRLSLQEPDAEVILNLKPDIIFSSGINTSDGTNRYKVLTDMGIPVADVPTSNTIEDIQKDIAFFGEATGTTEKAYAIIKEMQDKIDQIAEIGKTIPEDEKKTVYFEISPAPYLSSFGKGTFLNKMLDLIGAKNIYGNEDGWISPSAEQIIEYNPDVILTNVSFIDNPLEELTGRDGFQTIKAVQDHQVYLIDTNSSSRPTHHIVKALVEMAKAVYPEQYAALS